MEEKEKHTLHEARQNLAPSLQQWMTHHDLEKSLQTLPSVLDHIIAEPIREHFAWQWGDRHAR